MIKNYILNTVEEEFIRKEHIEEILNVIEVKTGGILNELQLLKASIDELIKIYKPNDEK